MCVTLVDRRQWPTHEYQCLHKKTWLKVSGSYSLVGVSILQNVSNLREFVKTHVTLTPGALMVDGELQFVLHFGGIHGIRREIRGGVQKLCFGGPLSQLPVREI